jgi:hypothetical protein
MISEALITLNKIHFPIGNPIFQEKLELKTDEGCPKEA